MAIKILNGTFEIGWPLWNRQTLDRADKYFKFKVLFSLNREEFVQVLAATQLNSVIYRNENNRYEEVVILAQNDCIPPLQVGVSGPPKCTMYNIKGIGIEFYDLATQATIVNHIDRDYVMCCSYCLNNLVKNTGDKVDFLNASNRMLIHFKPFEF